MVTEIKEKGAGPLGYQTFPAEADMSSDTTGIIYLGQDQEFWMLDHQICQGLDQMSGHCDFLTMSKELRDFLCWIPYKKDVHQYSPIVILATWFGVAYVINFILMNCRRPHGRNFSTYYSLFSTSTTQQHNTIQAKKKHQTIHCKG
ncbi:MAG: hypothetical protein GY861_28820 [bacterium]|nr:hypothetical protein [bacterium]